MNLYFEKKSPQAVKNSSSPFVIQSWSKCLKISLRTPTLKLTASKSLGLTYIKSKTFQEFVNLLSNL